jgi:hypothetical protein
MHGALRRLEHTGGVRLALGEALEKARSSHRIKRRVEVFGKLALGKDLVVI